LSIETIPFKQQASKLDDKRKLLPTSAGESSV